MRRRRNTFRVIVLILLLLQGQLSLASETERRKPTKVRAPVGELRKSEPSSLVIRNEECDCDQDATPPDVTLTTVGTEYETDGEKHFHPYLSIAVDKAYAADDSGEWLAVWNLGMSPPGARARLQALIPGLYSSKKVSPEQIAELERIKANVSEYLRTGKVEPPRVYLDATQKHIGSNWRLFINVLKNVLRVTNTGAQFVARTYFLNWKDYQERYFQQAYLALDWYGGATADDDDSLNIEQINDLKFRLLINRSPYGRWVDEENLMKVVYGYESQVRRWQAKTSSFLQISANEYHLGYTELSRPRPNGPPIPVCGILYYDPTLAPANGAADWPARNPFDLTYNPFTSRKVQNLAQQFPDEKIPLAVYVFQTDLLVKPIIVIDFFRQNNPGRREALATTKRLGDQALASTNIGLLFRSVNRMINWATNKKGFTYLATKSSRLGVEEMRLALRSNLYFDPDMSEALLDELDRVMLNPLIKPGRVEKLMAEINYAALRADGGVAVCREVQRVRERRIRQMTGNKDRPLTPADFQLYQRHLVKQPHLKLIKAFARDLPESGIPLDKVQQALNAYINGSDHTDSEARRTIFDLRLKLMQLRQQIGRAGDRFDDGLEQVLSLSVAALKSLYPACGLTVAQLDRDTNKVLAEQATREAKERQKIYEQQVRSFKDNLKRQLEFLTGFLESGCDVAIWSPSYWEQALEFFATVPAATAGNSEIREIYEKHDKKIREYLTTIAQRLSTQPEITDSLLAERREISLEAARQIAQVLFENGRRSSHGGE